MEAEVNSEMAYCVLLDTRIRFEFVTVVECVIFLALLKTDERLLSKETRNKVSNKLVKVKVSTVRR